MSSRSSAGTRIKIAAIVLALMHVLLIGRAIFVETAMGDQLRGLRERQTLRRIELSGARGRILDRNGVVLAMDVPKASIFADPSIIKGDKEKGLYAKAISEALNMNPLAVRKMISGDSDFVWIKKLVTDTEAEKISALKLKGIGAIPESERFYPNGQTAAELIGFMGTDKGIEAGEKAFEKWLKGEPGYILLEKDAIKRNIPFSTRKKVDAKIGSDVYLTIDLKIQHFAEAALEKAVTEHGAMAGSAVIMEPRTGRILAMAGWPSFDPNNFQQADPVLFRNRSISMLYEPGSTMKPIIAAAAFDSKKVDPFKDVFFVTHALQIGKKVVHEHECNEPEADMSPTKIMTISSNVGMAKVALKTGESTLRRYLKLFGFGEKYDFPLNGQEKGLLSRDPVWKDLTLATVGFGQGISVTELQMMSAFGAIGNGGVLMKPYLVEKVAPSDGSPPVTIQPTPLRRVISDETSRVIRFMMHEVVEKGTGRSSKIEGYRIGGKTGTAQVPGRGGYISGAYVASFIGMVPIDNPQLVGMVLIERPKGIYYGSTVAAPYFKEMMQNVLWYLNILPTEKVTAPVSY